MINDWTVWLAVTEGIVVKEFKLLLFIFEIEGFFMMVLTFSIDLTEDAAFLHDCSESAEWFELMLCIQRQSWQNVCKLHIRVTWQTCASSTIMCFSIMYSNPTRTRKCLTASNASYKLHRLRVGWRRSGAQSATLHFPTMAMTVPWLWRLDYES